MLKYRKRNKLKLREQNRIYQRTNPKVKGWKQTYRIRLKLEVFAHYGGVKCVCCGECELVFLTLDHIVGGLGSTQRKVLNINGGWNFYAWLKKKNYPTGYQVLCYNCNCAKRAEVYCPHQRKKNE